MHQVVEPPGVRRATRAVFVLFAGIGIFATIVIVGSGEGWFGLLFGAMFIGVPWIIHRVSMGPGVPGFTLSSDGILGAADDEQRLIPWGEVDRLAWRGTGLTVNGSPCLALHAELTDGRSVRVTTYTARRGKEVDEVVEQVQASGMLPDRVGFGEGDEPRAVRQVLASVSPPGGGSAGPQSWSELPTAARVGTIVFLAGIVGPILVVFALLPILLVAFAGPIGWIVTAVMIAVVSRLVLAVARRRREPVLACSFTIEGVIADHGDGLTIPWSDEVELRIDPTVSNDGPVVEGGTGRGWVVQLDRPGASPVRLSPVLSSRSQVVRAVGELVNAKRLSLIPPGITLALPSDLPVDVTQHLAARWDGS